jgi:hypothetical protein
MGSSATVASLPDDRSRFQPWAAFQAPLSRRPRMPGRQMPDRVRRSALPGPQPVRPGQRRPSRRELACGRVDRSAQRACSIPLLGNAASAQLETGPRWVVSYSHLLRVCLLARRSDEHGRHEDAVASEKDHRESFFSSKGYQNARQRRSIPRLCPGETRLTMPPRFLAPRAGARSFHPLKSDRSLCASSRGVVY